MSERAEYYEVDIIFKNNPVVEVMIVQVGGEETTEDDPLDKHLFYYFKDLEELKSFKKDEPSNEFRITRYKHLKSMYNSTMS